MWCVCVVIIVIVGCGVLCFCFSCRISQTVSRTVSLVLMCVCFFFQAEDGIRCLVRSRGLGDVYKRQEVEGAEPGNEREAGSVRAASAQRVYRRDQERHRSRGFEDEPQHPATVLGRTGCHQSTTSQYGWKRVHADRGRWPVSYTHLTLPQIYPV